MKTFKSKFKNLIEGFNFKTLFNELGWDNCKGSETLLINDEYFQLDIICEKSGFTILVCSCSNIPPVSIRKKIETSITCFFQEHLIIFIDSDKTQQLWQLKNPRNKNLLYEIYWNSDQSIDILFSKIGSTTFSIDEQDDLTIVDVIHRVYSNFTR